MRNLSLPTNVVALLAVLAIAACDDEPDPFSPPADAAADQVQADRPPDQEAGLEAAGLDMAGVEMTDTGTDTGDGDRAEMSDMGGDLPSEGASFCASCASDELCVLFHDGPCGSRKTCKKKTAACSVAACNSDCNRDMCGFGTDAGNSTCQAAPCPETALYPQAVHCYGP
jgi:hypothetical protein